jgi:hypothetical protein
MELDEFVGACSSCREICLCDLTGQKRNSKSLSTVHVISISSKRLMCMCSMGIIEEQRCHGSASRLSQAPLEDEQMTCLYYASIACTVVNLVYYLFSYARYSYADDSSIFFPLFQDPTAQEVHFSNAIPRSARRRTSST